MTLKTLLIFSLSLFSLMANESIESNQSAKEKNLTIIPKPAQQHRLSSLMQKLSSLESVSGKGNIWTKAYSNYRTYQELRKRQDWLIKEIFRLKRKKNLTPKEAKKLEEYEVERQTNVGKLQLLSEFQEDPFKKLLEPPKIPEAPKIGNPFSIISAVSYLKRLKSEESGYIESFKTLEMTLQSLKEEKGVIKEMLRYQPNSHQLKTRLKALNEEIEALLPTYEIFKTTKEVYHKKLEEIRIKLNEDIKKEVEKAGTIGIIILVFFVFFLLFKYLIRKYLSDKEGFYTINKVANFLFITIVVMVLLFAYIENVNYLVTILGFASAGIAIAMKDWFMSLMGWFVIVLGGSIHVGDRIKVVRNGVEYVGDVVDISMLRLTIQEDITLTTYMHNRRAGRFIFIPNNYIFTDMIANYSHSGLKTVWDGIDFNITFDSNAQKASLIAKEITRKYSKGYTDITRKQLNKLRSSYHLKNTNVEPRIYTFLEPYGIRVSAWYLTNAYGTLTLRSTISSEILARIQEEDDIKLAYPTQTLHISKVDEEILAQNRGEIIENPKEEV